MSEDHAPKEPSEQPSARPRRGLPRTGAGIAAPQPQRAVNTSAIPVSNAHEESSPTSRRGLPRADGQSSAPSAGKGESRPQPARAGLNRPTQPAPSSTLDRASQASGRRAGLSRPSAAPTGETTADTAGRQELESTWSPTTRFPDLSSTVPVPMVNVGAARGRRLLRVVAVVSGALVLLLAVVAAAIWIRSTPSGQSFIASYPGETQLPEGAPVGLPAWLGWQHFFNAFLMVLIIRSGWLVRRTERPSAYWTRKNSGLFKTREKPKKISLDLWLHLSLDGLWLLNGLVFVVLLFATGQWMRVVPTSWDIFPNALSAALQYASLNWPTENGWVNYNSLQVIAYFLTIFVAAPLATLTGFRMSGAWSSRWQRASRVFPVALARALHFPVMLYFVLFIFVHVLLVLTTGAIRNLNHMYAAQDSPSSLLGLGMFAVSVVVIVAAWYACRPLVLRPIASIWGKVSR